MTLVMIYLAAHHSSALAVPLVLLASMMDNAKAITARTVCAINRIASVSVSMNSYCEQD